MTLFKRKKEEGERVKVKICGLGMLRKVKIQKYLK